MEIQEPTDANGLGAFLRQLRLNRGLTQEALAERAGIGVRTIQGLEDGSRKPHHQTLSRLVTALEIDGEQRRQFEREGQPAPRRPVNVSESRSRQHASDIRATHAGHASLPISLSSFVGRMEEIQVVKRLLAANRLLTLTGAGGCGKTRLVLQVASDVTGDYPDGVWLVELAALTDPSLVAQTIANTLGLPESPDQSPLSVLTTFLQSRRCLLVVDNCEHLVGACALVVTSVLQSCSKLTVLTTSRQPLQVSGEVQWQVPSLPTPDPAGLVGATSDLESLVDEYPAIQLFVDRARAVLPDFALTPRNLPSIARICWHLDGLPLAIELAAARSHALGVQSVATRLDQRFQLLTNGSRVALPRQQTLQATIDWSYQLLTASERALFCQLAAFAGGWTLDAAETVCQGAAVVNRLIALVERSLVLAVDEADGTIRYRLLETIRQYAWEQLEKAGDADRMRDRHAAYYLALAAESTPLPAKFDRLEREHDNLRAALRWYMAQGDAEGALRLSGSLFGFWAIRGHVREGRQHFAGALALPTGEVRAEVRAMALEGAARLAFNQSDFGTSDGLYSQCLALWREAGNLKRVASVLLALGHLAREQGDFARANDLLGEAIEIARITGNRGPLADGLSRRGLLSLQTGDYARARESLEASLQIQREESDEFGVAWTLSRLGHVAHAVGDLATAQRLYAESLGTMRRWNDTRGTANLLTNLGMVSVDAGDLVGARANFYESAEILRKLQDRAGLAMLLDGVAGLAATRGQSTRALRLARLAESLRLAVGAPLPRNLAEWREHVLAPARQAQAIANNNSFEEQAMTVEEIIQYALVVDA